jgi:hypothetical protein
MPINRSEKIPLLQRLTALAANCLRAGCMTCIVRALQFTTPAEFARRRSCPTRIQVFFEVDFMLSEKLIDDSGQRPFSSLSHLHGRR